MKLSMLFALLFSAALLVGPATMNTSLGQEPAQDEIGNVSQDPDTPAPDQESRSIGNKIDDAKKTIDENETAQEVTDNILTPIKEIGATIVKIPGFYWIAFALMAAGFVSFLGQLVLGKLIMLTQLHFSMTEILSDGLGLLVSSIGLVLLTQAATADGQFIDSPFAVLSAVIVGGFFGLIFYFRGQTQELREARALRASRNMES